MNSSLALVSLPMASENDVRPASLAPKYEVATARTDYSPNTQKKSTIFRFPTEMLEVIFLHGARDYHSKSEGSPVETSPDWVNVPYICRHWRSIALNYPTLWTHLFIMSPYWTEELLSRSKQAPLRLNVDIGNGHKMSTALHFLEQMADHVERIEEFSIRLSGVDQEHQLVSKLLARAPLLRTMKMLAMKVPPEWEQSSVLFDGDTPALRTLEFFGCPVSWYSLNLTGLTTLCLYDLPARSRQNTAEFLATLRCMRNLKYLRLDNALSDASSFLRSAAFDSIQKINLPYLSKLFISAPLSTVVALSSCANIPLKTRVKLLFDHKDNSSRDDYALLSSVLSQRLPVHNDQAPSIPTVCSLVIKRICRWNSASLTFSTLERDISRSTPYMEWEAHIPLQVIIAFNPMGVRECDMNDVISNICCRMPLTTIQSVHVVNLPFPSTFWIKTLGHLEGVRYLTLREGHMPDLVHMLSPNPPSRARNLGGCGGRTPPFQMLVPALEILEMYRVSFPGRSRSKRGSKNLPARDVQSLYDALSTRASRGELKMVQCYIPKDMEMDMAGKWGEGRFDVTEYDSRPSTAIKWSRFRF